MSDSKNLDLLNDPAAEEKKILTFISELGLGMSNPTLHAVKMDGTIFRGDNTVPIEDEFLLSLARRSRLEEPFLIERRGPNETLFALYLQFTFTPFNSISWSATITTPASAVYRTTSSFA